MYITLNNFCKQKGVNKKTIDGRLRKKGIKSVSKVGNEFFYRKKDLEKLLKKENAEVTNVVEVYHIYESKMNYIKDL